MRTLGGSPGCLRSTLSHMTRRETRERLKMEQAEAFWIPPNCLRRVSWRGEKTIFADLVHFSIVCVCGRVLVVLGFFFPAPHSKFRFILLSENYFADMQMDRMRPKTFYIICNISLSWKEKRNMKQTNKSKYLLVSQNQIGEIFFHIFVLVTLVTGNIFIHFLKQMERIE